MTLDWPAEDYKIGAFIQHYFSNQLIKKFPFYGDDIWLDLGCGEGTYTVELAKHIKTGRVLAIDSSDSMIALANQNKSADIPLQFLSQDILSFHANNEFTVATAFWSLQWVGDVRLALQNVYQALKPSGRFLSIHPSTRNGLYLRFFREVCQIPEFSDLKKIKAPFQASPDNYNVYQNDIHFSVVDAKYQRFSVLLPSLKVFRQFVDGIKFFQGHVPESRVAVINQAMTDRFEAYCNAHHQGQLLFDDEAVVVTAVK